MWKKPTLPPQNKSNHKELWGGFKFIYLFFAAVWNKRGQNKSLRPIYLDFPYIFDIELLYDYKIQEYVDVSEWLRHFLQFGASLA